MSSEGSTATLLTRFVDENGNGIRTQGTYDKPFFCLKDICTALGIVNHRNKARLLRDDQKTFGSSQRTGKRGSRQMTFITEGGMYRVIISCREASIPGTAPHAFVDWITDDVLPSLRRNGRYELQQQITHLKEEKGLRLWNVFKTMNVFSWATRKRYFTKVCTACKTLCYTDQYRSPHVFSGAQAEAQDVIRKLVAGLLLTEVPADQRAITDYFQPA